MIERRRFLVTAGVVALAPVSRAVIRTLPIPASPAPLLASNALAVLMG